MCGVSTCPVVSAGVAGALGGGRVVVASLIAIVQGIAHELLLFAAVGFVIFGLDDVATDLIWIVRSIWRRVTVYRRNPRATAASLRAKGAAGRIAVFVPAWDESAVIAPMLRHLTGTVDDPDYRVYVGVYANDVATRAAAESVDDERIRLVVLAQPGPTTKADCLNSVWTALRHDDAARGERTLAIVLHDAEDVVHRDELTVHRALIDRFDFVQLPVAPLLNPNSRWIEGHYADEFAESHGKTLVVREAVGAGIPAAGVGCAFRVDTLATIADERGGSPFDAESLTEDYELGLRLGERGLHGVFVRVPDGDERLPVAVRAHFPSHIDAAVRQKSRWIAGIALSGWDRLGWRGGPAEHWMRLHDRRAVISSLLLLAAYFGILVQATLTVASWFLPVPQPQFSELFHVLLIICAVLLVWRLVMRFVFTARAYGFGEGLRSIPRAVVANAIAIMAARRAFNLYRRARRDGIVRWDKTAHRFPETVQR